MAKHPRIIFYDTRPYDRQAFDEANQAFGYDITYIGEHLNDKTSSLAQGHEAVCAFVNDVIDDSVIRYLAQAGIRLIALRSAGYNNVDLKAAYGQVHVVRVPAYSPYAVAEHAAALILGLNRKIHRAYYRTRDGNFSIQGLMGFDMHGKTAGIIGTGKIGKCLVPILRGFGMEVLLYDKYPDEAFAREHGAVYVPLEAIYQRSQIISLHCPLMKDTYHMINARSIGQMRPGVLIVNTSRGKLIDTGALIEGLKTKHIGGAGLDVYEEEGEYFFEDFSSEMISDDVLARLLTFPNVLMTSHQGFFTREALTNIAQTTLGNIQEFFDGGYLKNEICYRCDQDCRKKQGKRCF